MGFVGRKPTNAPLTSSDLGTGIVGSTNIADGTIANADIANATIALAKLSATGTPSAATFLRGDNAWGEAGAAAGQVIQVVTATDNTTRSTTGTSFVTASNTLSVSITPSSASNKILVMVDGGGRASNDDASLTTTIYRGATNLGDSTGGLGSAVAGSEAGGGDNGMFSMHLLDSPATTSSTTYQVYIKNSAGGGTVYINNNRNNQTSKSSITVMEIKG